MTNEELLQKPITVLSHRVIMVFGAGLTRNEMETFTGTEQECREYLDNLPTAEELEKQARADGIEIFNAYESTQEFRDRSRVEKIVDGDDPRWP